MNSYPHEFLDHPQPLMFVAGLTEASNDGQSSKTGQTSRERSTSIPFSSQPGSISMSSSSASNMGTEVTRPDQLSAGTPAGPSRTTPFASPLRSSVLLPTSPAAGESSNAVDHVEHQEDSKEDVPDPFKMEEADSPVARSSREREFDTLVENLRGALASRVGEGRKWIPDTERKDFRIRLVDKAVRLPLRKVSASSAPDPQAVPHSPLSPLTPLSPLYPDGLIAPVWVRKHAELVPSVFVLFLRLYESPPLVEGTEETTEEKAARETRDRAKEQEMDEVLVREIGERRRRLGERGIKLTVVLMASTETLESPFLDGRLSYLRRASALASRASLFVLTPVSADQLPDFVQSLQEAVFDAAMEYYANHTKRIRRKKARLPPNQFGVVLGGDKGRTLGSQGWTVRYEWKAGWFAELRQDFVSARRHYEDCWNELARMFASTQTLPPRTKRWAEAKVLADCVAIRICRLLLYQGQGSQILGPFFVHLKRFGDLSRGWGIGEETFEFWSWIARQYRVFAELLDLAVQAGLEISIPAQSVLPSPDLAASPTISSDPPLSEKPAVNPLHVLQPPAFYFYTAASCSIQRRARFLEAQAVEEDALTSEAGAASGYVSTAPGYANEKKVDHVGLIVELLTKAYTLFKKDGATQNRTSLFVAFRMAEIHCEAGQYDLALKLLEGVSGSFKEERWSPIVKQIRALWYESAQRTGNVESAARMLIEMMTPIDSGVPPADRATLQDDLQSIMKTTSPSSSETILIRMDPTSSILDVDSAFWHSKVEVSQKATYQVTLTCPDDVNISALVFESVGVNFSDDRPAVMVKNSGQSEDQLQHVNMGNGSAQESPSANLCWKAPGATLVIQGQISSLTEMEVHIASVELHLRQGQWGIDLILTPEVSTEWSTTRLNLRPARPLASSVSFFVRPHAIKLDVAHHPSGFVNEAIPITVTMTSEDDRAVKAKMSVFLQPAAEEDEATISMDNQTSSALIEDIEIGTIEPHQSTSKIVILKSPVAATKLIDFSLNTSLVESSPSIAQRTTSDDAEGEARIEESTHTAVIPVLDPFAVTYKVGYSSTSEEPNEGSATVSSIITCPGPSTLRVQSVQVVAGGDHSANLVSCSLENAQIEFPQSWDQTTSYAAYSKFHLRLRARSSQRFADTPAELVFTWQSAGATDETQTRVPFPPLSLPPGDSYILASFKPPSIVSLEVPFSLSLNIANVHPTLSSSVLIEVSTADDFVWTGERTIRLVDVLSGERKSLEFELIPAGKTGWRTLPKISIWEERAEEEPREVRLINERQEISRNAVGDGMMVFVTT